MIIPSILAELIILIGAVIIDVIFGEPKEYLHPVALVGKLSSRTEKSFMKLGNKVLAGFVFLVVIILVFTVPLYIVLKIVSSVHISLALCSGMWQLIPLASRHWCFP